MANHSRHQAATGLTHASAAAPTPIQTRNQLRICVSLLYTTVLFSTLALPAGAKQLPLSFLIGLLHFGVLAALTRGAVDPFRLLAVAGALCVIILETALFHLDFSAPSLFYVAAIYLPIALSVPLIEAGALRTIWKHVSILATVAAVLGLVQLAGQLLLGGLFLDPVRQLPEKILFAGYNTTTPVFYGSTLLKPNGMFLLEPSYYSQLVALGLLGELVYFHRKWRIALLMTAMTFSFSGTGILLLVPAVLFIGSPRTIIGLTLLAAGLATVVFALGFGDYFVKRAAETGDTGSSGDARFVAPYQDVARQWGESTTACLFGKGAGSSERASAAALSTTGSIPKVSLEYGLAGLSVFAVVWLAMFYGLALPRPLAVTLLLLYFVSTSAFLQPFTVFELWALSAGFMRATALKAGTRRHEVPTPTFRPAAPAPLPLVLGGNNRWRLR